MEAYFTANLPRLSEIHSSIEHPEVRHWGDVEVETFVLHQRYVFDGAPVEIEAPSTAIWRREGGAWRVALFHSVPLPPAT